MTAATTDAAGTRRRLQALAARGWSVTRLARRLGTDPANVRRLMRNGRVPAALAGRVRALYEELWDTPPPEDATADRISASLARAHAAAHGWPPPMAWDDDDLDDPDAPVPAGWQRRRLTHAERVAEAEELLELCRGSRAAAALRMGMSRDAFNTVISRARKEAS